MIIVATVIIFIIFESIFHLSESFNRTTDLLQDKSFVSRLVGELFDFFQKEKNNTKFSRLNSIVMEIRSSSSMWIDYSNIEYKKV